MSEDVGKQSRQRQLALDFPEPGPTLDGLAVSASNRTAISVLRRWPDWRTHALAVVGQAKSGLTTVARAWAVHAGGQVIDVTDSKSSRQEVTSSLSGCHDGEPRVGSSNEPPGMTD